MAELRAAVEADLPAIRALLDRAWLPTTDLEAANPTFIVLREDGHIVAAGALQRFGSSALVRSVVVAADRRGTGLGADHRTGAREDRECGADRPAKSPYPDRS